jgi:ribonuclease HI
LIIYVDGLSTKKNEGAEILLITPDREELSNFLKLEFKTTNNESEYEAIIVGLGMALELGAESMEVQRDS